MVTHFETLSLSLTAIAGYSVLLFKKITKLWHLIVSQKDSFIYRG